MSVLAEDLDGVRRQSTILKEKLQSLMNGPPETTRLDYKMNKPTKDILPPTEADSDRENYSFGESLKPRKSNLPAVTGTYFEEFKSRVNEIRSRQYKPKSAAIEERPIPTETRNDEEFLLAKIDRQASHIEHLEQIVQELKIQNHQLQSQPKQREKSVYFSEPANSRDEAVNLRERPVKTDRPRDNVTEREVYNQLRLENKSLQERLRVMAQRSHTLAEIHRHRQNRLQAKIQASLDLCGRLTAARPVDDDSTTELLYGPQDDSTTQLLQGLLPKKEKRTLRSYFLAVLFVVRIRREAAAERAWLQKAV